MSKYGGIMYPAKGVSIGVTKKAYQNIETLRKAGFTSMKDIENLSYVMPEHMVALIELFRDFKFNQMRRSNIVDYIFGDGNVDIFISENDDVEVHVEEDSSSGFVTLKGLDMSGSVDDIYEYLVESGDDLEDYGIPKDIAQRLYDTGKGKELFDWLSENALPLYSEDDEGEN